MTDAELQQTFDSLRAQLANLAHRRGHDAFVMQLFNDAQSLIAGAEAHFQVLISHNIRAKHEKDTVT